MSEEWAIGRLTQFASTSRTRVDPRLLDGNEQLIHYSIPVLDETDRPALEAASTIASHKFVVAQDSVLVSLLNPRIPRVWLAKGADNAVCSTEFAVLSPTSTSLKVGYLHLMCQSPYFWEELQKRAVGTTGSRQRAKVDGLLDIEVSVPPPPTQRRIVDLMTHLDAHIANLQAEGYACGVLLAALRLKIFTESRVRPRRLDEIVELIIDNRGKTPKKLGTEFTSTGCPVLSAVNVKDGFIVPSTEPRFIDDATYRRWMKNPTMKGDVLLTSEGPLGQVAQVPDEKPWVLGQRLFALRGAPNQLLNDYLMHFLSSELGQAALVQRSSGSTVRGIRQSELVQVLVPWIPIGHQMAVSGAMNGVVANLRALEVEVGRLRALRTAMTSTLLTGLVVIPEIYDNCIREVA